MNRPVKLPVWPPQRIISLVPSQTELLHDLGLGERVVGITKFCVHPPDWLAEKTKIGGTKTVSLEKVASLRPDLIIGNREENERDQIEALAARWPVWMSDIFTLEDALVMIQKMGELVGKQPESALFSQKIYENFAQLNASNQTFSTKTSAISAAYFIWRKPYMVAASGTFIDDLMKKMGLQNVFSDRSRYPEIALEELAAARPQVILLSSEPFPFSEKHFREFAEACPVSQIRVVDGEFFSWYGTRLLKAAGYLATLRADFEHLIL